MLRRDKRWMDKCHPVDELTIPVCWR